MKCRKKPIAIEFIKCSDALRMMGDDWYSLPEWFRNAYEGKNQAGIKTIIGINYPTPCIDIVTLEGTMRANHDSYILCGVKGEIWPIRSDIFLETYDIIEETA